MQSRLRLSAWGALVVLTLAACGSSAASGSPAPTSPPASGPASPVASGAATPAASDSAAASAPVAPSGSAAAAPSGSAAPQATPTPEEQALAKLLPTSLVGIALTPTVGTLAQLIATQGVPQTFVDFAASLGVTPDKVLMAYTNPSTTLSTTWSLGAWRLIGADPAKLKDEFIKTSIAQGQTATEQQVGGRTVLVLTSPAAPAASGGPAASPAATQPPEYLVFKGDTVFFGGSGDPTLAGEIVKALPQ